MTWLNRLLSTSLILAALWCPLALGKPKDEKEPKQAKEKAAKKYEALVALGFPHPFEVGVGMALDKKHIASVHAGLFERNFRSGKGFKRLVGSMKHIEARYLTRVQEKPFWTIAVGYQELGITGTKSIPIVTEAGAIAIDAEANIKVQSLYWTPQIGLTSRGESGLIYNFAMGIQIPFYVKASFNSRFTDDDFIDGAIKSTDDYQALKQDIEKLGERFGKLALPTIKLFEMGVNF